MPQIEKEYISTGKVKYVFRDLPLESIHPHAFKAAVAANCANEQGKYWEMYHRLFENQRQLDPTSLAAHAQAVGLDEAKFAACMASNKYDDEIRKDMADAAAAGVQGTPAFVIGLADAKDPGDKSIRILRVVVGAQPYPVFKAAIDAALVEAGR